jgi:transcriptional regulator with XRE-family HTH domain
MSQTKRRSSKRRQGGGPSPDGRKASDTPSAGRRFTPALTSVTEGGSAYGHLVAYERWRLGLTQKQLAAKIRTSPATVARIEQGHPPGAELRKRLTETLYVDPRSGLMRRLASVPPLRAPGVARGAGERPLRLPSLPSLPRLPHLPRPTSSPRLALGSRRLWGAVAIAFAVILLAVIGSRLSSGDGAPAPEPSLQVSSDLGARAAIGHARVAARKEAAAAKARRAAQKARERETAAAAAAAAAAARRARKAAAREQSSSADGQPAAAPVESSPSPPSGGGGSGGGGSNGPAPELQHGIGSGGGLSGG